MKPIAYYQNITGEEGEHKNRIGSRYWNEGKWNNFILPLLPTENRKDMTFVDIGANNGLFCKLAKEAGFKNAIGIETDPEAVQRGIAYRDSIGMDYQLLNRTVGKDFNFDEIPVADVYLLSNVHYYFELADWLKFLDRLKTKTVYCLIISRELTRANRHHWRVKTSILDTKYYFREWEMVRAKYRVNLHHMDRKDDPSPRELWSFLFKSKLNRKKFDDLLPGAMGAFVKLSREELIDKVVNSQDLNIKETEYYKTWVKRMSYKWNENQIYDFVKKKVELFYDISKNGVKDPILLDMDNKIIDGGHRIACLKALGYESIITRFV